MTEKLSQEQYANELIDAMRDHHAGAEGMLDWCAEHIEVLDQHQSHVLIGVLLDVITMPTRDRLVA